MKKINVENGGINTTFNNESNFSASFGVDSSFNAKMGVEAIIETGDYDKIINHPSIEGNELIGDKSFKQLGLDTLSVQEVEKILYLD